MFFNINSLYYSMIKNTLEDIIHKYYLGSFCESVKWNNTSDILTIKFINNTSNLFGNITVKDFDPINFTVGIFDTTKLLKLVKILDTEFKFEVTKNETKILLSDKQYNIEYTLADINVIPDVPSKVNEPKEWECIFELNKDLVKNILAAKKAAPDTNTISFNRTNTSIGCIIGELLYNSNKININIAPSNKSSKMDNVSYPLDLFCEVIDNNTDMNNGTVYISESGIAKIVFSNYSKDTIEINTTYYLIANQ